MCTYVGLQGSMRSGNTGKKGGPKFYHRDVRLIVREKCSGESALDKVIQIAVRGTVSHNCRLNHSVELILETVNVFFTNSINP